MASPSRDPMTVTALARAVLEAEREKQARQRIIMNTQTSAEVAIVGFQGGNDWIEAQRERQHIKLEQRAAIHASPTPFIDFDRVAFTDEVKRTLEEDGSVGFVINLKRRREFANKLCSDYKFFNEKQNLDLVLALAVDLGIQDLSQMVKSLPSLPRTHLVLNVMAAALGFERKNDPKIAKNIKKGLVPLPEQFFLLIGSVPAGPKFLLRLRVDLSRLLKKYGDVLPGDSIQALEYLDLVMRDLFATQAGTLFRRIDMSSEKLVAFVLKNERVHAVRSWMDLKRRISGPNRFCFGLFNLQMPHSPLVFVEVIISNHLCDKIDTILESDGGPQLEDPSHIVFYSISNANAGLRELNTASHLLFLTIERMTILYPQARVAATLSPVPGFASWFKAELDQPQRRHLYFTSAQAQRLAIKYGVSQPDLGKWLLKKLEPLDWHLNTDFAEAVKDVLVTACARYVLFQRKGDKMQDPVANFHLQNGAQVEQINFLADPSPHGMKTALGMMVNYRYCMTSIARASDSYKRKSAAAVSLQVMRLVWPKGSVILDEIAKVQEDRNVPFFARAFRKGELICKRGDLPTAAFFVCAGKALVHSAHPFSVVDGSVHGHHEILTHEPVPYSVQATAVVHAILLPKEDLQDLARKSSALWDYSLMDVRQRHRVDQSRDSSAGVSRL